MKHRNVSNFLLLLLCGAVFSDDSLVVSTTTKPEKEVTAETETKNDTEINPKIYSMHIDSNVTNRFATTLVTSKVRNLKKTAAETTFSVVLPENAFISAFEMEIEGKIYKAHVKEKQEAKQIYQEAVSRGQSAAHVELNARDSKTFTVSVNIEPESKTTFRLTYEELLKRQLGQYELVINIHPGQLVDDLDVRVHINESRPLTFVKTPSLRTGNEISKNADKLDPSAKIEIMNSTSALVEFSPDKGKQKEFGQLLGSEKESGLAGQFIVQYDVERDPQGGEVLVRDGYFVHFFSPSELKPLPKHIVFVLDHSGSMSGRKIDQLIEAMQNILTDLKETDLFNIVRFGDLAMVWDVSQNQFTQLPNFNEYGNLEPHLREINLPRAVNGTEENIEAAKKIIEDKSRLGMTNMMYGLEVGLFLIKRTQEETPDKYQPMIVFLTDGHPNAGMSGRDEITNTVTSLNSGKKKASIFSLSFGDFADKRFLRKISSKNSGFSRHIYESSDASLQLQDFYRAISAPLLSNVNFKYVDDVKDVTVTHYPILFNGSELVVAGRINDNPHVLNHVEAWCPIGPIKFNATINTEAVSSLERLWAYLTVKQMLKQKETAENAANLTKKALDLSLKYSFVTPITSLVVVKPNQTEAVDSEAAKSSPGRYDGARSAVAPSFSAPVPAYYPGMSSGRRSFISSDYSGRAALYFPPPDRFFPPPPVNFRTTRRPYFLKPSSTSLPPPQNAIVPQWLEIMRTNNGNITTLQGIYKLGQSGAVTTRPQCPKTPTGTVGECVIIFDCPEIFKDLPDLNTYLQYFCPLNEFAGVCCPPKIPAPLP
ncbi:inter-alpha-trypsin inhibitor heavy chain H4 isoform X2 [Tribolium castaneum]|uniref:inter-alpha-trypsin inhibitor heavy chain H4 isoform X2 n=1 Tax=Tribolium castaneum TaxID=7070 RepID=UPI00046C0F0B|nr:PREDICTED: inter-alpha-trypsin inhibitor heavy chain H4 isoform X2 [Tribolium castaneum]|eukprot:XP_008193326.1 PREDICTED: inter-alpha-trypsin inhibitor heavy chain H4 isoform X2 [Tribolium castaneum]